MRYLLTALVCGVFSISFVDGFFDKPPHSWMIALLAVAIAWRDLRERWET